MDSTIREIDELQESKYLTTEDVLDAAGKFAPEPEVIEQELYRKAVEAIDKVFTLQALKDLNMRTIDKSVASMILMASAVNHVKSRAFSLMVKDTEEKLNAEFIRVTLTDGTECAYLVLDDIEDEQQKIS